MAVPDIKKIKITEDSLIWMGKPLHFWDSINGDIKKLLVSVRALKEEIEKTPHGDYSERVENSWQASRELRKLVDREVDENISNAEIGKYFVVGTFAAVPFIPLAIYLPGAACLASPWFQYGVPATAALLSGAGVSYSASREWPDDRIQDLKDIPPAPLQTNKDFKSITPDEYLGLLSGMATQGEGEKNIVIDEEKSERLFRIPDEGGNATIRNIYTAMTSDDYNSHVSKNIRQKIDFLDGLHVPAYFVSMYRQNANPLGTNRNYCFNFARYPAALPCDVSSEMPFKRSGINAEIAEPVQIEWKDNGFHKQRIKDVTRWFGDDPGFVAMDKGMKLIAENTGVISLIKHLLPRMYRDCFLPEAAAALTYMLLNIFMSSPRINSDVKIYCLNLVRIAVGQYTSRLQKLREKFLEAFGTNPARIETIDERPVEIRDFKDPDAMRPYLEMIDYEKSTLASTWNYYQDYILKNVRVDGGQELGEKLGKLGKTVQSVYSLNPDAIRYRLSDVRYVQTAQDIFDSYVNDYTKQTAGVYDVFRNNFSLTGGIAGWFLHGIITSKSVLECLSAASRIGSTAAWFGAGLVVYPGVVAISSVDDEYDLLPLRLPHLTAAVEIGNK